MPEDQGTADNPADPVPADNIRDIVVTPSGPVSIKIDLHGRPLETTDQLGRTTRYERDEEGRIVRLVEPEGRETNYKYEENGRISEIIHEGEGKYLKTTYERNNPYGLITKVTDPLGKETRYVYTQDGNRIKEVINSAGERLSYDYDSVYPERITKVIDNIGNITEYSYTPDGLLEHVEDRIGKRTFYTYTLEGRIWKIIDAEGNETSFVYNESGDRIQTQNAIGNKSCYAYFDSGLMAWSLNARHSKGICPVADPDSPPLYSTRFEYDRTGRISKKISIHHDEKIYTYDENGRIRTITGPDQKVTTFERDAAGRVLSISLEDNILKYTYDDAYRYMSVEDDDSIMLYQFDGFGLTTDVEQVIRYDTDSVSSMVSYQYDEVGKRIRTLNQIGNDLTEYFYDPAGRIDKIVFNGNRYTFSYDGIGKRIVKEYPNGILARYVYDPLGRITSLSYGKGVDILWGLLDMKYDGVGNRIATKEVNYNVDIGHHNYAYDSTYRLTNASHPDQQALPPESYLYDEVGNRTSSHKSSQYIYDGSNRLLNDDYFVYEYDINGSMTSKSSTDGSERTEYSYNSQGKFVEAIIIKDGTPHTSVRYGNDGRGRRIWRKVEVYSSGTWTATSYTRYLYDGMNIIADIGPNGVIEARYLFGPGIDEPLAVIRGGKTYYYHSDAQHSIVMITDEIGDVINRYIYDSFGNLIVTCPSVSLGKPCIPNRYTYAGREWDEILATYYFRNRMYLPFIGRFSQEDYVQYHNLYSYASQNPISYFDPSGLSYIVYDRSENTTTLYSGDPDGNTGRDGHVIYRDSASNNASSNSNGRWPNGTFDYERHTVHDDDAPNSAYGSYGNYIFTVTGRSGMGVHSGRHDSCDRANRCGWEHATMGCIRTTEDIMLRIQSIHNGTTIWGRDELISITVQE
jgi:RHS repeat-associated protein